MFSGWPTIQRPIQASNSAAVRGDVELPFKVKLTSEPGK
jgi:hypothetical protein